jgi:hypothetical protein
MTTRGIGPLERLLARWSAARNEAAYGDNTRALARGEPLSD